MHGDFVRFPLIWIEVVLSQINDVHWYLSKHEILAGSSTKTGQIELDQVRVI
jgi:hypothetical protein